MKILLFIPAMAAVLFATSCRTKLPVDPMTNHPSTRCLPENVHSTHSDMYSSK